MNKTSIDWPNLDYTWNPIVGCANACPYCYARGMNHRFKWIPDWEKPQLFEDRLEDPDLEKKKPLTIFVGSMCDIFSEGVSWVWFELILDVVRMHPQHTFMFLTKRPQYYQQHENYPPNCWLGTTITSDKDYKRAGYIDNLIKPIRIAGQERIWHEPFCKRFLSIEPLLGPIPFDDIGINWPIFDLVIVGAMTGRKPVIPQPEWIASIKHSNIHWKANIKPYLNPLQP